MATIGKTISNPIPDNLYGPRSDKRDLMAENSILITYERPGVIHEHLKRLPSQIDSPFLALHLSDFSQYSCI